MKATLALIALVLISGCATQSDVSLDDRDATSRVFEADYETVSAATLEAMQNLNINVKSTSETPAGYVIVFTKSVSAWSWGETGRVTVRPVDAGAIVLVASEARHKLNVTATKQQDFAEAIFAGVEELL